MQPLFRSSLDGSSRYIEIIWMKRWSLLLSPFLSWNLSERSFHVAGQSEFRRSSICYMFALCQISFHKIKFNSIGWTWFGVKLGLKVGPGNSLFSGNNEPKKNQLFQLLQIIIMNELILSGCSFVSLMNAIKMSRGEFPAKWPSLTWTSSLNSSHLMFDVSSSWA